MLLFCTAYFHKEVQKKIVKLEQQVLESGWRVLELEKEKKEIEEMFSAFKKNHEDEIKPVDRK